MKYYAGIGSRETPLAICQAMTMIAMEHSGAGYTLRSGHADGADMAFEAGASLKEIWLPWLGFNGSDSKLLPSPEAFVMAEKYHPAWQKCSHAARKLHARNCHQVLGKISRHPPSSSFVGQRMPPVVVELAKPSASLKPIASWFMI